MAPPQQPKPKAKPAVTFRTKPGKEEVKVNESILKRILTTGAASMKQQVSVLNIRGPFSADIIRPVKPQTNTPVKSSVQAHRAQPSVSYVTARNHVSFNTMSKEPQTPNTMLQKGSCVSRRTGSSTHRLIGHSPGLRPLCLAGISGSTLKECLIIRSLNHQIKKKTPDSPAVQ